MNSALGRGALICALACHWLGFAAAAEALELLVGSWSTHSIRTYDTETNDYLGDFVTPASGGLNVPDGMDWGPNGNLFVASSGSNAILEYDGDDGTLIGEFATEGLNMPGNMQFGPDGLLYVSNKAEGEVLRFDPDTGDFIDVFATGGGLQQPVGLLWDDNMLYVSDFSGNAIRRFDATTGDPIDTFATVNTPLIMNLNPEGNLLVSSHLDSMIWEYDTESQGLLGPALDGGPVNCPVGHLFADGDLIVASWANNRLLRYDENGDFVEQMAVGNGLFLPNDLLLKPVPEPSSLWILLAGIGVMVLRQR